MICASLFHYELGQWDQKHQPRRTLCHGGELGAEYAGGTAGILEGLSIGVELRIGSARIDYALGREERICGPLPQDELTFQFGRRQQ